MPEDKYRQRLSDSGIESARVVVVIGVVVLAIFGAVRIGRDLEPRQRVVLVNVVIVAIAYTLFQLVQLGYLGQRSD
jgi:hypothetical protein